jgi:hypothetical protein
MHPLAQEVLDKYSEHFEMYLDNNSILINMLAKFLEDERSYSDYLEKRLKKEKK